MSITSPILISGAGISGLALAQALLRASIPFRIFERDSSLSFRPQGYRFRIQNDGVQALRQLLSSELFSRVKETCATTHVGAGPPTVLEAITAQAGKRPIFGGARQGGGPGGPPRPTEDFLAADRTVLRSVLFRGLEEHVSFNKEFSSYEITASGLTVHFADGTSTTGSLLVAADGAMSRIRKQFLPDHKLLDTEGRIIYGKTDLTSDLLTTLNALALKTMTLVQDRTGSNNQPLSLLLEPMRFQPNDFGADIPPDYIYWVLVARSDTFPISDSNLLAMDSSEAVSLSKTLTAHWHPSFHPLFELQNPAETSILRILTTTNIIPTWEPSARVTLIGDAAHVMSPSAGQGATTAIRDAAALARVIIQEGVSEESIGAYEREMRGWAMEALDFSASGGKALFGMKGFEELEIVGV